MIPGVSTPPLPSCPKCGRRIAAWKMEHCVYCGAIFPPELKQGVPEPEALKWVDRPTVPPDAAKKLEMMKVVPLEQGRRPRSIAVVMTLLSIPVFAVVFYLLYSLVHRYSPATAGLVVAGGALFLGYLLWNVFKGSKT
jgi:hypothetical protein